MEKFLLGTEVRTTLDDRAIIERVLDGETALFELLIRRSNAYLYKVARAHGFGHADAQDLMQESYLSAYRSLASFQYRSAFRTWLVKILLHHCHARWSKASSRAEMRTPVTDEAIPLFIDDRQATEHRVHERELGRVIEAAVLRLPKEHRQVFTLRELAGLSTEETAEALSISPANVKVRLHRSKTLLRAEIMKSYSPESLFEFHLVHCDKVVAFVMPRIQTS
jgi:RNA polymerase sigma factor (sigma-70 family)